jgi:hypothetical protein
VAQELYDGQGKKIIPYPRAEVRYLPASLIKDVPRIVAGLRVGKSFSSIPVPEPPIIRRPSGTAARDEGVVQSMIYLYSEERRRRAALVWNQHHVPCDGNPP